MSLPSERLEAYYRHLFPELFSSSIQGSAVKGSSFDSSVWPAVEQLQKGWESQPQVQKKKLTSLFKSNMNFLKRNLTMNVLLKV